MKLLVILAAFVASCSVSPAHLVPGDNSHYVEGESRYIWMPDGTGVPHLVDLLEKPSNEDMTRIARNGANNHYWLYTRKNPIIYQLLVHGDANSIWTSNYVASRPLKVIVHGWNSNGRSPINPMITAAFLSVMDCNVIVVDWSSLAHSMYWTAVIGVPNVGVHLGKFLIWLINTAGGNWDNVHLVGFSLGAHVVGNAGRSAGNHPARITGLDPAGPNWGGNPNALRSTDGQYVECIHTDGGILGIFEPIGTTNFYPNGGTHPQPGCWVSICSHSRAYELFASSVLHNHLVGQQCTNLKEAHSVGCKSGVALNMGNSIIPKRGTGIFGLRTGNIWPF